MRAGNIQYFFKSQVKTCPREVFRAGGLVNCRCKPCLCLKWNCSCCQCMLTRQNGFCSQIFYILCNCSKITVVELCCYNLWELPQHVRSVQMYWTSAAHGCEGNSPIGPPRSHFGRHGRTTWAGTETPWQPHPTVTVVPAFLTCLMPGFQYQSLRCPDL